MRETIPDLTFLISDKNLWEKDIFQKVEQCIRAFKENNTDESTESCFTRFCLDFDSAKYDFINKIREINLIINCRTIANSNSNFGGQQCAEFMQNIENACINYLNSTIYSNNQSEISLVNVIRGIKNMAASSAAKAWELENKAREEYASTGKDITLDIIKQTIYYTTEEDTKSNIYTNGNNTAYSIYTAEDIQR